MTSPSKAYIGCLLCANVKKNQFFCQIVGPGGIADREVLASAFGPGRDGALANAMQIAGVTEVLEAEKPSSWYEERKGVIEATASIGLMKALFNLEVECHLLAVQLELDLL